MLFKNTVLVFVPLVDFFLFQLFCTFLTLHGLFSREKRKYQGDLKGAFLYLKRAYTKAEEGLFIRACSDRTRGNGIKLEEGRFRLDIREEILYCEGGETLEQVAQRL